MDKGEAKAKRGYPGPTRGERITTRSARHGCLYSRTTGAFPVDRQQCQRELEADSFSDRSFSAAGTRVWNTLPSYLRQDMSYIHFKQSLKGHPHV